MRPSLAFAALFLGLIASPRADADPLLTYTLTDLGTSDTLVKDTKGDITGVSNAAGTVTYALDKSPVVVTVGPQLPSNRDDQIGYSYTTTFQTQGGTYSATTYWEHDPTSSQGITQTFPFYGTVSDVNIHGQMVGSTEGGAPLGVFGIPVAYGPEGLLTLSSYVNPTSDPTFYLRGAGAIIDDLGRILTDGSNGHEYLLTPSSLGAPQTVPEPSTLLIFGLGAAALMYRAHRATLRGPSPR